MTSSLVLKDAVRSPETLSPETLRVIGAVSGGWNSGCGRSAAKSRSSSEYRRPALIENVSENA